MAMALYFWLYRGEMEGTAIRDIFNRGGGSANVRRRPGQGRRASERASWTCSRDGGSRWRVLHGDVGEDRSSIGGAPRRRMISGPFTRSTGHVIHRPRWWWLPPALIAGDGLGGTLWNQ